MKNIFIRYLNYLKTRRQHREIVKELNKLSAAQLKDIGINRGDIDNLIWNQKDFENRGK